MSFLGFDVKQGNMKFGEYVVGVFKLTLICMFGVYVVYMFAGNYVYTIV